jgi:hypothetical protein
VSSNSVAVVLRMLIAAALLVFGAAPRASAYRILYAEQYYKLYHLHFYQYPDDSMENIYYLERALEADFANPLYALAHIETREQWAQYRTLFKMHVNLKLVELYLTLGSKYDKQVASFYNAPWRKQNLESLELAERMYRLAIGYWEEARGWAFRLPRMYFNLEEIQTWEDERTRILGGELDYGRIIDSHLRRLGGVRRQFEAMDENTY